MTPEYWHLEKVVKHIRGNEEVPHHLMNSAINEITDTFFVGNRRLAASEISVNAGKYLESWALLNFISAKYSDEDVFRFIEIRKTLTSRFSNLLPSIIEILNLTDVSDISSATHQIYDCAWDYPAIEKSQYSTQQRKNAVQGIKSIISLADQLSEALNLAGKHVDIELYHHKEALARLRGAEATLRNIDELSSELMALRFASQLALYRDEVGDRSFYVGDNKAKTHIVECAYRLALRFGAPVLKTTPGSEFSNLCSFIFEVATGIAHESLAGAINKFSRSPERQEIDQEEKIYRYENSEEGIAEYESDNFSSIKSRIKSLEAEEKFWKNMLSSRPQDENSIQQVSVRMLDVLEQKQLAMKEHGPFLVWASQMSRSTLDEQLEEFERRENKILSLAVELGQKVRNQTN